MINMDYITFLFVMQQHIFYNEHMDNLYKSHGFKNEKLIVLPPKVLDEITIHPLINALCITDIGYFPDALYHYRERLEGSSQNILIYCTNGEGWVDVNGQKYTVRKEQLIVIPSNIPHRYSSSINNPWSIYWIHFTGDKAEYYFKDALKKGAILDISIDKHPLLIDLFVQMYCLLDKGYFLNNMIHASNVLGHFLSVIFFMDSNELRELNSLSYIERCINYMNNNIGSNITLDQLAHEVSLTKNYLVFLFREKTGYTPIDFMIRLKIQRACQLLDLTELQISEIASALGYNDPLYFSRIFKKITGETPSSYRLIKKG